MSASQSSFALVGTITNNLPIRQSLVHEGWPSIEYRPSMASTQPSRHQRSLTEDNNNKRPLFAQMRSRSNTSTSSSEIPFARKALSPEYSLENSPRGSLDRPRSRQSRVERPESFRRTLVSKSSRLFKSRPSSKDDLTSLRPLEWSDDLENDICPAPEPAMMVCPTSRHSRKASRTDDALHRYNISEPFNFQHLTHTEPTQYKKMEEASQNDLVSEFSAIRASQAPRRELQGIKAKNIIPHDELYSSDSESEISSPPGTSDGESPRLRSYRSPNKPPHGLHTPRSPPQILHHARSIDSLSQISPILPRDPNAAITPITSQQFTPDLFPDHQQSPSAIENFPSIVQELYYEDLEALEYPTETWSPDVYDLNAPHAMTTPDDKAHTLRPPPFQMVRTELSRVLEEDEFSEGRRSIATASTLRPSTPSSVLRQSRSFPNLRQSYPKVNHTSTQSVVIGASLSNSRPSSIIEQTLTDIPDHPKSCESILSPEIATSWEEAIDWCYDNEAEADCNFDWHCDPPDSNVLANDDAAVVHLADQPSTGSVKTTLLPCPFQIPCRSSSIYSMLHSPARLPQRASSIYSAVPPTPAKFPQRGSSIFSPTPTLNVPSQTFVPDLDPPSAVSCGSSLDSVSEAVTPREGSTPDLRQQILTATCKPTCRDWTEHTPSPPVDDPESIVVYEDLHHVIYARKSLPEPAFDFGQFDGSTVSSMSPRSSRSAISKKSSQESVWSRHNRHSSSSASVPELTRGKAVDNLTDHLTDRLHNLEATVTCADAGQAAAHRRRSRSVAREMARNSTRSKATSQDSFNSDMDEPLPYFENSRDVKGNDASLRTNETMSQVQPQMTRSRSGSSAASSQSATSSHRYSLFPAAPIVR